MVFSLIMGILFINLYGFNVISRSLLVRDTPSRDTPYVVFWGCDNISKMCSDWWGIPSNTKSKYRSMGLLPSWAESPAPASLSIPAQANQISASQWAFVPNQTQSIKSILLSESETGSLNRPPKLMHMNEYPGWEKRFHTYVLGQNTELWLCFTTDFDQALDVADSTAATFADLMEDEKRAYDLEKKAYSILTQALSKDIYHQFVSFKT
ncbi:hypothetical protein HanHA300_Chr16g0594521 [Helianthus annuus]|nr:hypothetical protein HanHA300_Chr16g0594521 [Helianthus annuus]KAJ0459078.1 hypothetical protein HanHA89_Chr16g0644831 [Helianthus annuus]KAJ0639632.1 hypothetical protein HanLR1_Chr16g0605951 [Helianthus annuus]